MTRITIEVPDELAIMAERSWGNKWAKIATPCVSASLANLPEMAGYTGLSTDYAFDSPPPAKWLYNG